MTEWSESDDSVGRIIFTGVRRFLFLFSVPKSLRMCHKVLTLFHMLRFSRGSVPSFFWPWSRLEDRNVRWGDAVSLSTESRRSYRDVLTCFHVLGLWKKKSLFPLFILNVGLIVVRSLRWSLFLVYRELSDAPEHSNSFPCVGTLKRKSSFPLFTSNESRRTVKSRDGISLPHFPYSTGRTDTH